jgi:hypothetical protein
MIAARGVCALLLACALVATVPAAAQPRHRKRSSAPPRAALLIATTDEPAPPSTAPEPAQLPTPRFIAPPPPPVDAPSREHNWGLLGGGLALFAAGYALDIGITYGVGHQPGGYALIPLIGPLIQLGDNWAVVTPSNSGNPQIDQPANQRIGEVNHTIQVVAYAVLSFDFAVQLVGATLTAVGAAGRAPRRYAAVPSGTSLSWSVAPGGFALRF